MWEKSGRKEASGRGKCYIRMDVWEKKSGELREIRNEEAERKREEESVI